MANSNSSYQECSECHGLTGEGLPHPHGKGTICSPCLQRMWRDSEVQEHIENGPPVEELANLGKRISHLISLSIQAVPQAGTERMLWLHHRLISNYPELKLTIREYQIRKHLVWIHDIDLWGVDPLRDPPFIPDTGLYRTPELPQKPVNMEGKTVIEGSPWSPHTTQKLQKLLGNSIKQGLTIKQAMYLANIPPDQSDATMTTEVYNTLEKLNLAAFIPMDFRRYHSITGPSLAPVIEF